MGRIAKPHGLAGQVVVDLVTNVSQRLEPGTSLSTSAGPNSSSSPRARSVAVDRHFRGNRGSRRGRAGAGLDLLAAPVEEPGALWVDELVGASVFDQHGAHLGIVASLLANPASDLLELEGGGLVPLVFVVEHGQKAGSSSTSRPG